MELPPNQVVENFLVQRLECYKDTQMKAYDIIRNAIYTVRTIVDRIVEGGDTVNICAIDLTKAFDKVNHSSLFMKLMKRYIPIELLQLLENWLSDSLACVKWGNSWSQTFKISSGVRQGTVLSPFLFAVYVDE